MTPVTDNLPNPPAKAIIYDSKLIYAALASYPITRGHTIVVWKKPLSDLGQLNSEEYSHLMFIVNRIRNALMKALHVEKVYLLYMDEIKHVHWHLIPRYNFFGMAVLKNKPKHITTFPLASKLKALITVE